jgi:hypothetical protein
LVKKDCKIKVRIKRWWARELCHKIGATRAANNGATVNQLEALFGWSGGGMASLYTRSADRARLGLQAAGMLVRNDQATSMLSPDEKVGGGNRNSKAKTVA